MKIKFETIERADEVSAEALWLAYQAASPMGMGFLHERGGEKREDVVAACEPGKSVLSDYVFGRMIKLYIRRVSPTEIEVHDTAPRSDYQSWCHIYPTYEALIKAAAGLARGEEA